MNAPLLALALTLLPVPPPQDPVQDPQPPRPDPAITADELEHHVRVLASDELEGRESGTEGAARAARYLARALEAAGCRPGGDGGTFLQAVPLVSVEHEGEPLLRATTVDGEVHELAYGADFTAGVEGLPGDTGVLAVRLAASEADLPAVEEAAGLALHVDASSRTRREWLEAAGLEGAVGLHVDTSPNPSRGRFAPRPRLMREVADEPDSVTLRGPWAERLEAGEVASLELTWRARVARVVDHNVVGLLRGVGTAERPELAEEAVVFSAHYDHIGLLPAQAIPADAPEDLDVVCNGADDDASGVAAVLELAGALAAGEPPARTLVFLLATGEEKGLLGTWHHIDHPAVPLERTVANLNFEMVGRPDELVGGPGRLWLTGFERSNLGPAFREAGIGLEPDPRPEQNFFARSDNIAFVRRGIVGQTLSSYNMHTDYHRPGDEADTLDYDHMQEALRAAWPGVLLVTGGELTPAWLPGEPDLGR